MFKPLSNATNIAHAISMLEDHHQMMEDLLEELRNSTLLTRAERVIRVMLLIITKYPSCDYPIIQVDMEDEYKSVEDNINEGYCRTCARKVCDGKSYKSKSMML